MAETAFLAALAAYLGGAGLAPAPALVGVAEPADADELPALVLSLDATARVGFGLGERTGLITKGVLPVQARIDLANPVLPAEPTFRLLDPARRVLVLPHGGLVRQDGSDPGDAPLAGADITVTVANAARDVVASDPGPSEVRADPQVGTLTFGAPLPLTGTVAVSYALGQWEQRLERIAGTLRVDVCAADAADAAALSDATLDALLAPAARQAVRRLLALAPAALGAIGAAETTPALRRRTLRLTFTFEHEINRPESSGGVIRRVQVASRLGDGTTPAPGAPAPFDPASAEEFALPAPA